MIAYALVHVAGKHHPPVTTFALIVATYAITLAYAVSRVMMTSAIGRWIFNPAPSSPYPVTPAVAPFQQEPARVAAPARRRASA